MRRIDGDGDGFDESLVENFRFQSLVLVVVVRSRHPHQSLYHRTCTMDFDVVWKYCESTRLVADHLVHCSLHCGDGDYYDCCSHVDHLHGGDPPDAVSDCLCLDDVDGGGAPHGRSCWDSHERHQSCCCCSRHDNVAVGRVIFLSSAIVQVLV